MLLFAFIPLACAAVADYKLAAIKSYLVDMIKDLKHELRLPGAQELPIISLLAKADTILKAIKDANRGIATNHRSPEDLIWTDYTKLYKLAFNDSQVFKLRMKIEELKKSYEIELGKIPKETSAVHKQLNFYVESFEELLKKVKNGRFDIISVRNDFEELNVLKNAIPLEIIKSSFDQREIKKVIDSVSATLEEEVRVLNVYSRTSKITENRSALLTNLRAIGAKITGSSKVSNQLIAELNDALKLFANGNNPLEIATVKLIKELNSVSATINDLQADLKKGKNVLLNFLDRSYKDLQIKLKFLEHRNQLLNELLTLLYTDLSFFSLAAKLLLNPSNPIYVFSSNPADLPLTGHSTQTIPIQKPLPPAMIPLDLLEMINLENARNEKENGVDSLQEIPVGAEILNSVSTRMLPAKLEIGHNDEPIVANVPPNSNSPLTNYDIDSGPAVIRPVSRFNPTTLLNNTAPKIDVNPDPVGGNGVFVPPNSNPYLTNNLIVPPVLQLTSVVNTPLPKNGTALNLYVPGRLRKRILKRTKPKANYTASDNGNAILLPENVKHTLTSSTDNDDNGVMRLENPLLGESTATPVNGRYASRRNYQITNSITQGYNRKQRTKSNGADSKDPAKIPESTGNDNQPDTLDGIDDTNNNAPKANNAKNPSNEFLKTLGIATLSTAGILTAATVVKDIASRSEKSE